MHSTVLFGGRSLRSVLLKKNIGKRLMHLQEYRSKQLLQEHGLRVQRFVVVDRDQLWTKGLNDFYAQEYVVKAQVLAGGRGKGHFDNGFQGGVHIAKDRQKVVEIAKSMIGHRLITKQTDPSGVLVEKVMIAESVPIVRETYLTIMMDRSCDSPVVVASPAGGMDIEQVALEHPERIMKMPIDLSVGLQEADAKRVVKFLGFSKSTILKAAEQLSLLYALFTKTDATMIEVNPFCEIQDDQVYLVDAKLQFDDNAAYRQREVFNLSEELERDERELKAAESNLNFISLDGNIGCLVNGAGLAMATMDLIKLFGGRPANFLDVGGTAGEQQIVTALRMLSSDASVKTILVNIFGGIVNCEAIAGGLVAAFRQQEELTMPIIVRLEGTNVDGAKLALKQSGLPFILADGFENGVQMAVESVESIK